MFIEKPERIESTTLYRHRTSAAQMSDATWDMGVQTGTPVCIARHEKITKFIRGKALYFSRHVNPGGYDQVGCAFFPNCRLPANNSRQTPASLATTNLTIATGTVNLVRTSIQAILRVKTNHIIEHFVP